MLNTPILFIVFNRADTTRQVFEAIRKAKPKQLFVAADGPRPDKEGEKEKCDAVRKIATGVDWDCEVKTLFREENKGCGLGPAEAITWFFENVEQGIILEDDCLPDHSFFNFCEELLNYYADNEKVMHISGNNFQFGKKVTAKSYYFSTYSHNWGWATWRRAWKKYKFELSDVDNFLLSFTFSDRFQREVEKNFWTKIFLELKCGKHDVWDGQWQYTVLIQNGVSIIPNVNLVKNIGFNSLATHTFSVDSILANMATSAINKILHPSEILINKEADTRGFDQAFLLYKESNLFGRLKNVIKKVIKYHK